MITDFIYDNASLTLSWIAEPNDIEFDIKIEYGEPATKFTLYTGPAFSVPFNLNIYDGTVYVEGRPKEPLGTWSNPYKKKLKG